ncbi:S-layer homology domain-containing protein [Paenibacillus solisilvae]|uniref:S-layer homology domain-containing protein n=1 Tax=Paenibacillus solisilvae TaxID=2486751 RepID=A0ABW0VUW8_9BACL
MMNRRLVKKSMLFLMLVSLILTSNWQSAAKVYADSSQSYEAEAQGNTMTGNAAVSSCSTCSGENKVGGMYQGSSLQFNNITVSEAGTYTVTIDYISGDPRSANVSVNGTDMQYVEFPKTTDWDTVGSFEISIALQAGSNTILIDDNNWYAPDIDRISIGDKDNGNPGDPGTVTGVTYEAEDAANVMSGNAQIADCSGCSGGKKVGNLYNGSSLLFPKVTVEKSRDYAITVSFISGDPRSFYVSINGGEAQYYDSLKTEDWNTVGTYKLTAPLAAGDNTILISDGNGYAPDIDGIQVQPADDGDGNPAEDEGSIGDPLEKQNFGSIEVTPYTSGVVIGNGQYKVTYHSSTGYLDYAWTNGQELKGVYGSMKLNNQMLETKGYETHDYTSEKITPIANSFGTGIELTFIHTGAGKPTLKQVYQFYENKAYFLTRLDALSDQPISTNYMAPIVVNRTGGVVTGHDTDNRALSVPFDNDAWIRYKSQTVNRSDASYEVTAIYDNTSRNGLVIGSINHDTWKTGIEWTGSSSKLNQFTVYGGASSSVTHDSQPHGSISGTKLSSPLILTGGFADYRTGLEQYGEANALIAPPLQLSAKLPQGVPVGWNSWGAYGSDLSFQDVVDTSNYFKNQLPAMNNNGAVYINMDSYWDNLTAEQLNQAVATIKGNGQQAGIYWGPFVYWGNNMSQIVEGTNDQYTYGDIVLKDGSGTPLPTIDGAYALDPTHPGTKLRMDYYLNKFKGLGFTFIKLDFLTHGSLEGAHYDPKVTTGIQAYNEGMRYMNEVLDGSMFISESIAPIFPSQYAHSRRISCDTYGAINESEYELNSLTYGWWQNDTIYSYTDPDHMALTRARSLTEARSRVNSAVISGTVFLDSDDVHDAAAQQYMTELYSNPLINQLVVKGKAFMPVEGNTGANAADTFVLQDGSDYYIAVFNYSANNAADKTIDLARAGLSADQTYNLLDVWTGDTTSSSGSLSLTLQPAESKLFKLTLKAVTPTPDPGTETPNPGQPAPNPQPESPNQVQQVLSGKDGGTLQWKGVAAIEVPAGAFTGSGTLSARLLPEGEQPAVNDYQAVSPIVELLNSAGSVFTAPVQLTFNYNAAALTGDDTEPAIYYFNEQQKRWIYVGGTDNGDGTITVSVNHFTKYAVFAVHPKKFADLTGHWSESYASRLIGMNSMNGFVDGTFRPNDLVTRAQFARILADSLGLKASLSSSQPFADASSFPAWALNGIEAVKEAGLMQGSQAGNQAYFNPNQQMTRAEIAVVIAHLLASTETDDKQMEYKDAADIPQWAQASVDRIQSKQVMTGFPDQTFRPAAHVTRGETAKVIALLLDNLHV